MKICLSRKFPLSPLVSALILFCLTLTLRVALVWIFPFDGLYGQDAYAYFDYARVLFAALTHGQMPPPFWWPLGYPFVLNVGFLFGGVNIATAQFTTIVCGALVVPLAFALAYEASLERKMFAGWVAGLICAACGQLAQSSVVIMADAPALMFATLGAWLLLRYARTRNVLTLCVAAFAVGMSVWIRWQNLIFAVMWILTLGVMEWKAVNKNWAERILHFCFALGLVGIVLLPQLLIRVTTNAPLAGQTWLEGWNIGNFFARTFDIVDGHFEYALPVAIFYGQLFIHPAYLVGLLTPLFLVGVWRMNSWRTSSQQQVHHIALRRLEIFPKTILVLGWILGMYFFLAGIPYENFRFPLGLFVPIAVVTGIGAAWFFERWQNLRRRFVLMGWIGLALLIMLVWQPRVLAPVVESKSQQLAHTRWLEAQLLPNALVYAMSIDGALATYSHLRVENLWDMDPMTLKNDMPTYLYVDTNNIETQWRGRLPDQLLRALNETNYLHPVGSYLGWTLYRVH